MFELQKWHTFGSNTLFNMIQQKHSQIWKLGCSCRDSGDGILLASDEISLSMFFINLKVNKDSSYKTAI